MPRSRIQLRYLAPEGEHIGLDGASGRSVVVEPSHTAVDLEGWNVEEPPLEGIDDGLTESFPASSRGPIGVAGDGPLKAAGNGARLHLERFQGLDGGVDLGLMGVREGLESAYGLGLGIN